MNPHLSRHMLHFTNLTLTIRYSNVGHLTRLGRGHGDQQEGRVPTDYRILREDTAQIRNQISET